MKKSDEIKHGSVKSIPDMKLNVISKKIAYGIFAMILVSVLFAGVVNAEVHSGDCGSKVQWSLDTNSGVLTISGTGNMQDYSTGTPPWKKYAEYIKAIDIKEGVTSIGDLAFCGSLSLGGSPGIGSISLSIPSTVKNIGFRAFDGCSGLTYLSLPYGVETLEGYAFCGCGITSVSLPNSIKSLGTGTFSNCNNLKTASLSNSLSSIPQYTFSGCTVLTNVYVPNSVTSIGTEAFEECTSLSVINLPTGLTSIGDSAFYHCSGLTSIDIPSTVTSIAYYAFCGCSGLSSIEIPAGVGLLSVGSVSNLAPNSVIYLNSNTGITTTAYNKDRSAIARLNSDGSYSFTSSVNPLTLNEANAPNSKKKSKWYTSLTSSTPVTTVAKDTNPTLWLKTDVKVTSISVSGDIQVTEGSSIYLSATVYPTTATNKEVTWMSSNSNIATVSSNGRVTGISQGSVTITATATDGSGVKGTKTITVVPKTVKVTEITVSGVDTLSIGNTFTLSALIKPTDATNKLVTWSSSNPTIASIDSNGLVTGLMEGTVTITATAKDGSNVKGTKIIEIVPQQEVLNTVNIIIPVPVAGAVPATSVTGTGIVSQSVTWSPSVSSTFDAGVAYKVTIKVKSAAGYLFPSVPAVTINGNSVAAAKVSVSGNVLTISEYLIGSTDGGTISSVSLTVDAPVTGAKPDATVTKESSANYDVSSITWYKTSVNSGNEVSLLTSFEGSTIYVAQIKLTAKDGYVFDEAMKKESVKLNSKTVSKDPTISTDKKVLTLQYTFPATIDGEKPTITLTADPANPVIKSGLDSVIVKFTYKIMGDFDSASLNFGDGTSEELLTQSGGTVAHTYNSASTYTVTLRAGNEFGIIIKTLNLPITKELFKASFSATPLSGEAPLQVTFTDTSSGTSGKVIQRMWEFGDGTTAASQTSVTHTFEKEGNYYVKLFISDGISQDSTTKMVTVTKNPSLLDSLTLHNGWNFISVPKKLDAAYDTAAELFTGVNTGSKAILIYDAESKLWEQVLADTKITPLNAYWIYSVDEITLTPAFNTVGSTPGLKTLKKGWNAVGLSAEEAHPASIVFNGMNWRSYISWNAAGQKYDNPLVKGQSGKYGEEKLVSLWKGGWVYMEEDGTYLGYA